MYLLIDPAVRDMIKLSLFDETTVLNYEKQGRNNKLLESIDSFFTQENFDKRDLEGIAVVVGYGTFTSIRIGCVVANTFGYTLSLPLLPIDADQSADPKGLIQRFKKQKPGVYISAAYSAEPNIGKKHE